MHTQTDTVEDITITSLEVLDCFVKGLKKVANNLDFRLSITHLELYKSINELNNLKMSHILTKNDFKSICALGMNGNKKSLKKKYYDIEKDLKSAMKQTTTPKTSKSNATLSDNEPSKVLKLLDKLDNITTDIEDPQHKVIGRPIKNIKQRIICMALMTYFGKSSRKSYDYMKLAKENGYISSIPHYNTILTSYSNNTVNDILHKLIPDDIKAKHKGLLYKSNFKKEISQQNEQLVLLLTQQLMDNETVRPAFLLDKKAIT